MAIAKLIIYGRSYCHLCDDMEQALRQQIPAEDFCLEVLDVDQDPAAVALYDELVPVMLGRKDDGGDEKLCHYFFDLDKVRAFIAQSN